MKAIFLKIVIQFLKSFTFLDTSIVCLLSYDILQVLVLSIVSELRFLQIFSSLF